MLNDNIVEGVEPRKERKRTIKRARKGSPVAKKKLEEGSNLFLKAKRIQENLRLYMVKHENKPVSSVRDHITNKIQCLVKMIETSEDKDSQDSYDSVLTLVQRAINETLSSEKVHDMLTKVIVEISIP